MSRYITSLLVQSGGIPDPLPIHHPVQVTFTDQITDMLRITTCRVFPNQEQSICPGDNANNAILGGPCTSSPRDVVKESALMSSSKTNVKVVCFAAHVCRSIFQYQQKNCFVGIVALG